MIVNVPKLMCFLHGIVFQHIDKDMKFVSLKIFTILILMIGIILLKI
jgi:hypothetical protein